MLSQSHDTHVLYPSWLAVDDGCGWIGNFQAGGEQKILRRKNNYQVWERKPMWVSTQPIVVSTLKVGLIKVGSTVRPGEAR